MSSTVDESRIEEHYEKDEKTFEEKIGKLAGLVREAKGAVCFFTGAGVSTSSGVGDYRGPSGAWTKRLISELKGKRTDGTITEEESAKLDKLLAEAAKEQPKTTKRKTMMQDAEPSATHMAMATLIRTGLARSVVTTNLDGIYRKAGLRAHENLVCLHGDIYAERCTNPACGYEFERNWETRLDFRHVHDHAIGVCSRCGSKQPEGYRGQPTHHKTGAGTKFRDNGLVSTKDKEMGTKDTHINFGEYLDSRDWNEAEESCKRCKLCIVAGTSMSLRHITHMPFLSEKVVIINLQETPDDEKAFIRIWDTCDKVFVSLLRHLGIEIDLPPIWYPRDALPIAQIPRVVHQEYRLAAIRLARRTISRGGLVVGHSHAIAGGQHAVTVFVRPAPACGLADITTMVKRVRFVLEDPKKPASLTVDQTPFEITNRPVDSQIDVTVIINFVDEVKVIPKTIRRTLVFADAAPTTISFADE